MAGRQITRDDYRFGYQGQFSEYDEETGWNAFELRMYDSRIGRWLSVDPAGQFASPYLGMGNNPIIGVDPDGGFFNPIYDKQGNFLGTDDRGLQGEAIVMDAEDFNQGMSHADALRVGTLLSNYSGPDNVLNAIEQHVAGLPERPDWDGEVTFREAIDWYHNGGGRPLYVDIGMMDFKSSTLSVETHFKGKGFTEANFFWGDTHLTDSDIPWVGGNFTMSFVYGVLRVELVNRHTGLINLRTEERFNGGFDRFDFNIPAYEWIANGMRRNGNPTPFNFMGYGKGNIHVRTPVLR